MKLNQTMLDAKTYQRVVEINIEIIFLKEMSLIRKIIL